MDYIRSRSKSCERKTINETPPADTENLGAIEKLPANLEEAGVKLQLGIEGGKTLLNDVVKDSENMVKKEEKEREREEDRNRDTEELKDMIIGISEMINVFFPEITKRIQLLEKKRDWNKERENERERERDRGKMKINDLYKFCQR